MEKFLPKGQYKSQETLISQLSSVEDALGQKLSPESFSVDEICNLSVDELKSRFPKRYEIYLGALRALKSSEQGLLTEEGDGFRNWLTILNSVDSYDTAYRNEVSEDPRHPVQQEVFSELRDFLEKGNRSGYVKLPTGSGKTIIFKRFLEAANARSLIVVPNNVLVSQTVEQLNNSASLEGNVGVINMDSKQFDSKYTVTTYASLIKNLRNGSIDANDYAFVILDEAHKALGAETVKAIDSLSQSVIIGFTATPEYTTEKGISQILDHEIYQMEVAEAIRAGMLSNARTWVVKTGVDISSVSLRNGEFVSSELEQKLNVVSRNKSAVEIYKKHFMGEQAVAYCISIAHAESVRQLFIDSGISAEVISGRNTRAEKDEIIQRYKEGDTQILCNADILIEGFDFNKVSVCLNLRPTMSAVIAEQRGGRVLRLDSENPSKTGYVIDFLDDDKLASGLDRDTPILYREVLGAAAVPRAVSNEKVSVRAKGDSTGDHTEDSLENIDFQIINTEEQFEEILQQKEKYKQMVEVRKNEKKLAIEDRERARRLQEEYLRIKPEFESTLQRTRTIVNFVTPYFRPYSYRNEHGRTTFEDSSRKSARKLFDEVEKVRNAFYDALYLLEHRPKDIAKTNISNPEELLKAIRKLYDQAVLIDKGLKTVQRYYEKPQQTQREGVVSENDNETKHWVTKSDLKGHGQKAGFPISAFSEMVNKLEAEHQDWVKLRSLKNGNVVHIYSPEFLDEISYKIFEHTHRREMVSRGLETKIKDWSTEQDISDMVSGVEIESQKIIATVRSIEQKHPQWVALKDVGGGNLVPVYSPEFIEELETIIINIIVSKDENRESI